MIQPQTAQEASTAVKYLTAQAISFNVKGGGHSTSQSSCAPSPTGAVLDLSLMRHVAVDVAGQTVTFGGGCKWSDVDDALWRHGLATPGGTVSHTGVGGLILHGGFGVLSGLHGLTVDCLISMEVVLASGEVVTASESENPDLFWALRGAGSSFGVVTSFVTKVFPQGDAWGGMMVFSQDKLPALVDFFNFWAANNDGHQVTTLAFSNAPPGPTPDAPRPPVVILQFSHLGANPSEDGERFFASVLELEALVKHVGPMPYPALNKMNDENVFPPGNRYLFGGANFKTPLSLETVQTVRDKFFGISSVYPTAGTEGSICLLEGIPNGKSRQVPTDSMAFNSRGDYYNVGIVWTWNDPSLDGGIRDYNRQFQRDVRSLGYDDADFKDGVGRYLNYVSTGSMSAREAFGGNGTRLSEVKAKYDPSNVFDKLWKLMPQKEEQWAS